MLFLTLTIDDLGTQTEADQQSQQINIVHSQLNINFNYKSKDIIVVEYMLTIH